MKKDSCFLLQPRSTDGGGNFLQDPIITIRRTAAIGDVLAATCVADKLSAQGFLVGWQSDPAIHCVLRKRPTISRIASPGLFCDVDLDNVYEKDPHRRSRSFASYFIGSSNDQLVARGIHLGKPTNCTPRLHVQREITNASRVRFERYPRPWIFVVPRSQAWMARTVMDDTWSAAAKDMIGTKFWLGLHPAPPEFVDLKCQHLDNCINWMSAADLVVSTDTGPLHIAAALGIPAVAIGQASSPDLHLSDQNDFITIWPDGLDCLNCQSNVCPKDPVHPPCQKIDPAKIAAMANARVRGLSNGKVSAVISIYKPDRAVLQRCLDQVLPQVDEVVLCWDKAGVFPDGIIKHPKIRMVRKNESDIGYGRKQNYATRHAHNEWVMHLNDDCFLEADAVSKMLLEAKPGVGIVTPLLRFPDGTIYHAGKFRSKGVKGWGHIDWKQREPTFKQPVELENTCGCCVMVRRKAFYDSGCYDEDFYICAEDDSLSLSLRRAGYRIIFTPHAVGTHLEHHSANKTQNFMGRVHESNEMFGKKWSRYLEHNSARVPLGNFDY